MTRRLPLYAALPIIIDYLMLRQVGISLHNRGNITVLGDCSVARSHEHYSYVNSSTFRECQFVIFIHS